MELFLLLLVSSIGVNVCTHNFRRPCAPVKACLCTEIRSSKTAVDCHGASLNTTITCSICKKINNVIILDVSDINLPEIPASCFEDCLELEELFLASNNITRLGKHVFNGLANVKMLNLDKNRLAFQQNVSEPEIFKPLQSLRVLSLRRNVADKFTYYLENIDKDSLPELQTLLMDGLPNAKFGSNFKGFRKLNVIDLSGTYSYCNIWALTNQTFENLSNLTHLNLSFCNISTVEAATFKPLHNLSYLNISYNMALGFVTLRNVSYGLQFSKIDVLDYSKVYKTFGMGTELRRCDLWYLKNTNLKELRLNSNRIVMVEMNACALFPASLQVLWAEDNRLSYGPYTLQMGCLENLTRIELSKQEIAHDILLYNDEVHVQEKHRDKTDDCHIPKNFSKHNCPILEAKPLSLKEFSSPTSLKTINCRMMNMGYTNYNTSIVLPIENNVESLDISENVFFQWSSTLFTLYKLKNLTLSGTSCSHIASSFFATAPNIEMLDLSNNQLGAQLSTDEDGFIFKDLNQIRSLDLSRNLIARLPLNVFRIFYGIESLCLSFNRLQIIEFDYKHMKNLTRLNLRENKLSTIPLKLLQQMDRNAQEKSKNISIDLSDNELDMSSCDNVDFLAWIIEHKTYFTNIESYKFRISSENTISFDRFLKSFSAFEKSCHSYTVLIVITSVLILCFIFVIISGIAYRYRWRLRYFYYMTKARYSGDIPIRNSEYEQLYQYDAFISYSHEDYVFVKDEILTRLEEEAGLSLCIHQRDFLPGNYIAENILQAIKNSRMTVILLSSNFLKSKWCLYEFNMARMESIYSRDGRNVIFVVMYEDIDLGVVSPEMRLCLESESFLKFPQDESEVSYFWQMLKHALKD